MSRSPLHWFWRWVIAVGAAYGSTIACVSVMVLLEGTSLSSSLAGLIFFYVMPMLIAAASAGAYAFTTRRWGTTPPDNGTRCRKCGHILRGITEPRCMECGERT